MASIIKRLVGPVQVATGPTTQYTVPANTKARARHVHISNPSASIVTITITIGADAAGTRLLSAYSVPANTDATTKGVVDFYWDEPLEPGEIITTSAGTNNILVLTIGGEERPIG